MEKILLASPRGFCAGVSRAVKTVEDALALFGPPVYIKHEIVHNATVVKDLERRGAVTVENAKSIPEHSVVVFSAHGSPPQDYEIAREKQCTLIDATCPLVSKVHLEMHRFLKDGFSVLYIGHKNHPEGIGVMGEAKHHAGKDIPLIESEEDVERLSFLPEEKLAFLTQTTLSLSETEKIIAALKRKYPHIVAPPGKDICYATTNRQNAITSLAKKCDLILVIGSKNSSNSNRLAETARAEGVPAFLIDGAEDIDPAWLEQKHTVGISAGASAPESRVQDVVSFFKKQGASVENHTFIVESTRFPDPPELKKLWERKKP
ncbi:MAG: 4-hydroxy-3-methylbut-2-enyl diphosphate reductase [Candidatus Moraniibacteriota bacterium]|nr:MAG: 4-hydroxy-3-methylbut-2-enyl diphosphate reductase [Candidatus Moranbacteria bacterium]